ncbi:hypothetical protein H2198_003108 [Neophaeococcomyces mojaviensis]|uniref:Uncharacterized protein n=1 Tax=Neophaeococcomyces mojaviensis TaxID=3383035 RepID=A0ACC3ACE4_9EURO|nr:hypothetical protein H2198_003108 [Knufia sp. JES_112]
MLQKPVQRAIVANIPQSEEKATEPSVSTIASVGINQIGSDDRGNSTSNLKLEMQVEQLTQRVDALQALLGNVVSARHVVRDSPGLATPYTEGRNRRQTHSLNTSLPVFSGPTSSTYGIDVATDMLSPSIRSESGNNMGVRSLVGLKSSSDDDVRAEAAETGTKMSVDPRVYVNRTRFGTFSEDQNMLAAYPRKLEAEIIRIVGRRVGDMLRLLQLYQSVIGVLHPILDIEVLEAQVRCLYGGIDYTYEEGDLHVLTATLAIALLAEGAGASDKAIELYEITRYAAQELLMSPSITLKGQLLLTVVSMYHFFCDDHRMASRVIAIAARLSLEAGLYRREVLKASFPEKKERLHAVTVLWSIFVLDRQFSFATGLPQCLQENDVDLPEVQDAPYLRAMASYVKLGERAWRSITDDKGMVVAAPAKDKIEYFQYELHQWQKTLPPELQPHHLRVSSNTNDYEIDASDQYLMKLLYLRANQLKLLILRPLLFTSTYVAFHTERIVQAVEVAKDTIDVLVELKSPSNMYHNRQPIFNHFLNSALAALFLAYGQQIRNGMSLDCTRDGLKKGLDLARSLCEVSSSSRRLLKNFSRLKELIARLFGDVSRPIGRDNPLSDSQALPHWTSWPATLPQDLKLDQEFDFSFLFGNNEGPVPLDLTKLNGIIDFAPQVTDDIYDGLQDYAWMFQDF